MRPIFPRGVGGSHGLQYKAGGPLISVHHVGVPLLLAPAVPVLRAVQHANPRMTLWPWHIEMIALAALAAQLLYLILKRLSARGPAIRVAVWASVVFSAPLVVYANQIYPETPGALLALFAVYALLREPTRFWLAAGASAASLLPWVHVRFLPLALGLVLALAYRAIATLPATNRNRTTTAGSDAGPLVGKRALLDAVRVRELSGPHLDPPPTELANTSTSPAHQVRSVPPQTKAKVRSRGVADTGCLQGILAAQADRIPPLGDRHIGDPGDLVAQSRLDCPWRRHPRWRRSRHRGDRIARGTAREGATSLATQACALLALALDRQTRHTLELVDDVERVGVEVTQSDALHAVVFPDA